MSGPTPDRPVFATIAEAHAAGPDVVLSRLKDGELDHLLYESAGKLNGYPAFVSAWFRLHAAQSDAEAYAWARLGIAALQRAEALGWYRSASRRWQTELIVEAVGRLGARPGDPVLDRDQVVDWLEPLIDKQPLEPEDAFTLDQLMGEVKDRLRNGRLSTARQRVAERLAATFPDPRATFARLSLADQERVRAVGTELLGELEELLARS
jgi:hypothetical protein